jgi:hypothetical protein
MGLECVIVDSGALREVAGEDKHIHISKREDGFDLTSKLAKAMKVTDLVARKKEFGFDRLVSNLKELLQ